VRAGLSDRAQAAALLWSRSARARMPCPASLRVTMACLLFSSHAARSHQVARAAAAQLAAKLAALDDAAASSSKAGGGRARRGAGAPRDGAAAAARAPGLRAARGPETSLTVEATKAAVGAFFRQCATPKGRCENCGAYNLTLRRRARRALRDGVPAGLTTG